MKKANKNHGAQWKEKNVQIMGILEGEEIVKGTENIFKTIMAENVPNPEKEARYL